MAEVRLEGIRKEYGDSPAVRDLDLFVRDKEFLCLLGPSGCGKSTILNIVAGLVAPTSGRVYIDEKCVNDLPPKDRGIAMVFQDYALYPHMTVFDNLAFPLKAQGLTHTEIRRRVEDVAEILGIAELLGRLPKELSGGQKQRVALGRAIVRSPKVFLMDEPLSNVDARLRVHMRAELKRLHHRLKTTTIYVTHDQAEAMTLADRVAVLDRGVLQQLDGPLGIYYKPGNTFVAGFVGTVPMNFVIGRICVKDDVHTFEAGSSIYPLSFPAYAERDDYSGREVVLGIRPEDIQLDSTKSAVFADMTLEMVEHLGSDAYIHLMRDKISLMARVPPDFEVSKSHFRVSFDSKKVHLFDRESGLRITQT